MNTNHEVCINVCNSLLRGEISANEVYRLVIDKFLPDPATEELRKIREDHANSIALLSANIRQMGGIPDHNSGAWGILTVIAQGAANILGENSALDSLRKGEEIGRESYNQALLDENVMPECKTLIREKLLPAVANHIAKLVLLNKPAS
jgi:hypothetical protein